MAEYYREVSEIIYLSEEISTSIDRSFQIYWSIFLLLGFITLFLIFQHFLIKAIEDKKERWRWILISLISFILILIILCLGIYFPFFRDIYDYYLP